MQDNALFVCMNFIPIIQRLMKKGKKQLMMNKRRIKEGMTVLLKYVCAIVVHCTMSEVYRNTIMSCKVYIINYGSTK